MPLTFGIVCWKPNRGYVVTSDGLWVGEIALPLDWMLSKVLVEIIFFHFQFYSFSTTLAHIWNRRSFAFPPSCWPSSQDLGLSTDLERESEHYRYMLGHASIVLNDKEDHLAWGGREVGGQHSGPRYLFLHHPRFADCSLWGMAGRYVEMGSPS